MRGARVTCLCGGCRPVGGKQPPHEICLSALWGFAENVGYALEFLGAPPKRRQGYAVWLGEPDPS
jgi:hypothetical protein